MSTAPDTSAEHGGLQRVLGVPALFSAAYGNVGSSIYYALGLVAGFALGLTPIAFIISGVIFIMTALTYAEGTTAYPEAGGASSFARHAFNEFVSFVTAWAQLLNFVVTMAISAFFVPHYLGVFWEPLKSSPGDAIGAIVVMVLLAAINIFGVEETAALTVALALADFGTQVLLAVLGLLVLVSPNVLATNIHWGVAPTWSDFLIGITLSMIAYTGIETISNMAEETRDPVRAVPRAIGWVVAAVLSLYIILPIVALSAMPVKLVDGEYVTTLGLSEAEGGYAGDPFIGLVRAFDLPADWMLTVLEGYVGVLAAVILFIATNAGIIGVSRLSYSMAQYRQMPQVLRKLHPTRMTPYVSITIFTIVGCLLVVPPMLYWATTRESWSGPTIGVDGSRQNEVLGNLYAFGAMLSFSIAHLSVLWMRWRGDERPWTAPGGIMVGSHSLALFALVGLLGTGSAWVLQVATHPLERTIGFVWMAIGPVVYIAYRRSIGVGLFETARAPIVVQAPSAEITYGALLVPVLGGRLDHSALVVACRVAAERGAQIVVLGIVEVPQSLPLHADLAPEIEAGINAQLDVARLIASEYGVDIVTRVQRARRAETAVLEEALRRETELIVLGVSPRRHLGLSLVGRTNERIIRRSPVRVVLVREQDDFIQPGTRRGTGGGAA